MSKGKELRKPKAKNPQVGNAGVGDGVDGSPAIASNAVAPVGRNVSTVPRVHKTHKGSPKR